MVIPVGPKDGNQKLVQIDKALDGTLTKTTLMGVVFASLTDLDSQCSDGRLVFFKTLKKCIVKICMLAEKYAALTRNLFSS